MKQVDRKAQKEYGEIVNDTPSVVHIPGTRKLVKIRGIKPYTIERLTRLWVEREAELPKDSSDTLKSLCIEPYFAVKQAVLMTLNSYLSIRLFYGLKWRIWAKIKGYTDEQMMPIIQEGKKKLPLTAHWMIMAYSVDMRNDWMKMTSKEAEQYRAELLSVVSQLSSKSSQPTEQSDGPRGDSKGTGVTDAY